MYGKARRRLINIAREAGLPAHPFATHRSETLLTIRGTPVSIAKADQPSDSRSRGRRTARCSPGEISLQNRHESRASGSARAGLGTIAFCSSQLTLCASSGAGRLQDIRHIRALAEFIESCEQAVGRAQASRLFELLGISYAEQTHSRTQ